jgi:hypothetical protein
VTRHYSQATREAQEFMAKVSVLEEFARKGADIRGVVDCVVEKPE